MVLTRVELEVLFDLTSNRHELDAGTAPVCDARCNVKAFCLGMEIKMGNSIGSELTDTRLWLLGAVSMQRARLLKEETCSYPPEGVA